MVISTGLMPYSAMLWFSARQTSSRSGRLNWMSAPAQGLTELQVIIADMYLPESLRISRRVVLYRTSERTVATYPYCRTFFRDRKKEAAIERVGVLFGRY